MNVSYVPAEEFAKATGSSARGVIERIREGSLNGYLKDNQWHVEIGPPETANEKSASTGDDYRTARGVSKFISGIGWIITGLGIFAGIGAMAPPTGSLLLGIAVFGGFAVSGLILVAAGQITRATLDNANSTRQILEHLRGAAS